MDAEAAKIIVPVATFLLGALLTLAVKGWDYRRDKVRASVASIRRLTNDWYNQLHAIWAPEKKQSAEQRTKEFNNYVSNRKILPELIMHLEIVRAREECASLVAETESFLRSVTAKPARRPGSTQVCHMCAASFRHLGPDQEEPTPEEVLEQLDRQVQAIAVLAARILK